MKIVNDLSCALFLLPHDKRREKGGTWQHLSWAKIVFNCGARSWHLVIAECTATDTQYSRVGQ